MTDTMKHVPYDELGLGMECQPDAELLPEEIECMTPARVLAIKLRHLLDSELLPLCAQKGTGYGTDDDPLANLRRRGLLGIAIRLEDKVFRLGRLLDGAEAFDERAEDTLKDMVLYAMYAILIGRGDV